MVIQQNHRQVQQERKHSTWFVVVCQSGSRSGTLHCYKGSVWGEDGSVRIHFLSLPHCLVGSFMKTDRQTDRQVKLLEELQQQD